MSDQITYPTIHLNGNSKGRLQGQYQATLDKARDLIAAVGEIELHGRDYYPQGGAAFATAREEFIAHLVKPMQEAESYLEKITIHISQQGMPSVSDVGNPHTDHYVPPVILDTE